MKSHNDILIVQQLMTEYFNPDLRNRDRLKLATISLPFISTHVDRLYFLTPLELGVTIGLSLTVDIEHKCHL